LRTISASYRLRNACSATTADDEGDDEDEEGEKSADDSMAEVSSRK
jgi:hypothetical protein